MLGLGWPEILLIGAVAIIAIGPKDIPVVMRQIGRITRKARLMYNDFSRHWEDLPNQVDLLEMQNQADDLQRKTFEKFNVDLNKIEADESVEEVSKKEPPKP